MKFFKLHWLDGQTQYVKGCDITSACNNVGINAGALRVLDYYEEVDNVPLDEKLFSLVTKCNKENIPNDGYISGIVKQELKNGNQIVNIKIGSVLFSYYIQITPTEIILQEETK